MTTNTAVYFLRNKCLSDWLEKYERLIVWFLVAANTFILWFVWLPISDTSFDDAMFTDPAARFLSGRGFTSAAHYAQGPDTFYASNVPLQQILLIPWLQVFGLSHISTQAINVLYVLIGTVVLMEVLRKSQVIGTSGMRILFLIVLLASGLSVGLSTLGRPDALCFLIAVVAFAGALDRNERRGTILIAVSSMLAPWASLSLAAMFAFFGTSLLILRGREAMPRFLSAALGGLVGIVCLGSLYLATGTADVFLNSIRYYGASVGGGESVGDNFSFEAGGILRNPLYYALLVVLSVVSICAVFSLFKVGKHLVVSAWLTMIAFPVFMILVGVFPDYYAWMLTVPSALVVFCALSTVPNKVSIASALAVGITLFALLGPKSHLRQLVWALENRALRIENKSRVTEFVGGHVQPEDKVLVETRFYYNAIAAKADVYAGWQPVVMDEGDIASLSLLLLGDKQSRITGVTIGLDAFQQKMNGWQPVGEPLVLRPTIHNDFETFRAYRQVANVNPLE